MKSLLLILTMTVGIAEKEKTVECLPAVAQPSTNRELGFKRLTEYLDSNYPYPDIELGYKIPLYVVYSKEKWGRDSIRLKKILEGKNICWTSTGKEVEQLNKRRDAILEKFDITLIDGDNPEVCLNNKVPRYHTYYPLIKTNRRDKWIEFPEEHRRCFMYLSTIIEWLEYQHALHLEDKYREKRKLWPRYSNIEMIHRRMIARYLLEEEKKAFVFLINKGINPTEYQCDITCKDMNNGYYGNAIIFNYYRFFYKRIQLPIRFIQDGMLIQRWYTTSISKQILFQDHDFEKIKKDFPEFKMPEDYTPDKIKLDNEPFWTDKPFDIKDELHTKTFKEVRNFLDGGWNEYLYMEDFN